KDGYKYEKSKVKKVKRTVPAWASISASKKVLVTNFSGSQHRVDDVLLEAIMVRRRPWSWSWPWPAPVGLAGLSGVFQSCSNKAGVSYQSLLKYVVKKYPGMEIEKKKFLLKKAMKKHLEKGTIKQLKGKGLSGTFAIGNKPVLSKKCAQKMESLGDALPLIITRLCEPKEASYNLIRKYLEQHFPHLRIDSRPDVLRTALVKAVERGQLERITGKGASGTFQVRPPHTLPVSSCAAEGGALEDAIAAAITAMNEPKTCSTTILRRYLLDANKDRKQYQLVAHLRRTLSKCKVLGWMEQITGHGFNGTYQLSFPFYPRKKKASQESEEDDDNDEEEEEESEEEEAPPRRRAAGRGGALTKKAASSAILAARNPKVARKEPAAPPPPKATPTKKSAPARKTRTPAVKKMSRRGSRPGQEAPQRRRAAPRRSKVEASGRDSAPSRKEAQGGQQTTRRGSMGEAPAGGDGAVTRSAEYLGSFPVEDLCLDEQMEQLHTQLEALRDGAECLLASGARLQTLLMAHALRRVSLSTARPADAQFAFVSHNPGRVDAQLYCHVFQARHAPEAQFLNLLLCRCFQLSYLDKHPEEAQEGSAGCLPQRNPSLLNHGFPLSVSALVSFRRAPFLGLLPGTKKKSPKAYRDPAVSQDEAFASSPSLVRKKAIRTKELRSGAYRSFTFTPLKQRNLQERLKASAGPGVGRELSLGEARPSVLERDPDEAAAPGAWAPSLAETEEAVAQAVWCWAGIAMLVPRPPSARNAAPRWSTVSHFSDFLVFFRDSSCLLLADDVLGSYLLCPHPKKTNYGSLVVRTPSGLVTRLVENTRKGKFLLEKSKREFGCLAELIEHYATVDGELPCLLSCARVNHCYEWEEKANKQQPKSRNKHPHGKKWL
ncbi:unnamed protein product, partial [Tetraodon nigroviridis]